MIHTDGTPTIAMTDGPETITFGDLMLGLAEGLKVCGQMFAEVRIPQDAADEFLDKMGEAAAQFLAPYIGL